MKLLLALVLSLAPMTAATANKDWLFLGKDSRQSWVYANKQDIAQARYNQTGAKIWMAYIHSSKVTTTKSTKVLVEINCRSNQSKILNVIMFRGDGSNESSTPAYTQNEYIVRGSNIQGVADAVCVK